MSLNRPANVVALFSAYIQVVSYMISPGTLALPWIGYQHKIPAIIEV